MVLEGTSLGRFRLVRKLAEGGMAEVYLAVLTGAAGFEKPAVVKRMLPSLAAQTDYRALFVDEARLMASFSHSNLVSVLDFGETDGSYFLALEYVEGVDLHRAITVTGGLPPAIAVQVCSGVLRGLSYVHTRRDARGEPLNVVHRDVSPQNVLLAQSGDVKLGDFGIAKSAVRKQRTAPGATRGKLRYMSPEQAAGKPLDARADLFAVGLMLHEAITGQSAFGSLTEAQLLLAVRDGRVGPLETFTAKANAALAEVVRRAVQPDPAARFQSADQMDRALCAALPPAPPSEVAALAEDVLARLGVDPQAPAARERGAFSAALLGVADEHFPGSLR